MVIKNTIKLFTERTMELHIIILSKINQTQKTNIYFLSYMNSKRKQGSEWKRETMGEETRMKRVIGKCG